MSRRLVLLLLFMVLPLQAFASVHLTLSALRQQAALVVASHEHMHAAQHADHTMNMVSHHGHCSAPAHGCSGCDVCMPPLAYRLAWTADAMSSVAVAAPELASSGIIPPSFDRPPQRRV